jgi:seryl-tRNA synthetase
MLDLKIIRQNPTLIKDVIKKRNIKNLNLDDFLVLDKQKLELLVKIDELRNIRNTVSAEIPKLKDSEKATKISEMKKL